MSSRNEVGAKEESHLPDDTPKQRGEKRQRTEEQKRSDFESGFLFLKEAETIDAKQKKTGDSGDRC